MISIRSLLRHALGTLLLGLGLSAAAADVGHDEAHVRQVLMSTFDKPEARLVVAPVVVVGPHAVAGWTQGERGGRALLARVGAEWRIALCAGDGLTQTSLLREAGVPPAEATRLAQALATAEARLPATQRAKFASFDGVVRMDAHGHHPPAHAHALTHAQTTVKDPWVRGTVAQQKATGMFAQITSSTGGKLVSASSPVAQIVEIHEMAMEGDMMKMRAIPGLELPAGKAVELKPGGYHVMLIDLKQPLKAGDTVPVKLVIEGKNGQRETIDVNAPVRALGGAKADHKH